MEIILAFFKYLVPFSLLLGTLVFIHELGHYLAARYFGVRVEVFSLGFGPKLIGYKWGDTYYCISLIPLGGYVKLFGDNPRKKIKDEDKKYAFLSQKVWPKSAIALAGPVMNFFIAVFLFTLIGFIGIKTVVPRVGDLKEDSPAFQTGFRSNDLILSVNQEKVSHWRDVNQWIQNNPENKLVFQIQRKDMMIDLEMAPKKIKNTSLSILGKYLGDIEGLIPVSRSAHIGVAHSDSLAYKSGLRAFDEIKEINSIKISHWRDMEKTFQSLLPVESILNIKVLRDQKEMDIQLLLPSSSFSLSQIGIEKTDLYVDRVKKDSPADQAGLLKGDRLFSVEGKILENWEDVLTFVSAQTSERFNMTILRDGESRVVSVQTQPMPIIHPDGQLEYRNMIGVASAQYVSLPKSVYSRTLNPFHALSYGVKETVKWVLVTGKVLWRLLTGSISHRVLGGPISIAKAAKNSISQSIVHFLSVMAIISVNLFLINLLPIPILDGGHLLLFAIEGIRGNALSVRKQEMIQMIGLVFVLFFIGLTVINDVKNWNIFW